MPDTTLQSTQEITDIDENNLQPCKKCNLPIYEGHAYELGDDRWHINCFKCSKCNSSLGCNSNFLVLGNGNLICSNCSYNCKQCGKKIDDLAILTGDQAYCSSCFKCRSCKLKIEDLRYARTSKGLFCMSCHEKLIAKKKKYDLKRKQIAQLQQQKEIEERNGIEHQQTPPQAYDVLRHLQERSNSSTSVLSNSPSARDSIDNVSDVFTQRNKSNSSLSTKDKVLPPPPSNPPSQPSLFARESFNSTKTDTSLPSTMTSRFSTPTSEYANAISNPNDIENDYSIEEVNDSDDELKKNNVTHSQTNQDQSYEQISTPPTSSANDNLSPVKDMANGIRLDIIDSSEPSTPRHNQLQPAATFTPQSKDKDLNGEYRAQSPTSVSKANFKGKNLLILSPNNLQNEEFLNPSREYHSSIGSPTYDMMSEYDDSRPTLSAPVDESKVRSGCPSPFAKANRQARVVETNDYSQDNSGIFLDNEDNREDGYDVIRTPKKMGLSSSNTNTTSPPPKLPLPVIPSSPVKKDKVYETPTVLDSAKFSNKIEITPKGLGLAGVDYDESKDEIRYFNLNNENQLDRSIPPQSQTPNQKSPATPAVTNLETPTNVDKDTPENKIEISRKSSLIRTPKLSLKHKRSVSGGNGGISQKFGFFKSSNKDEPLVNPEKPRHGSVGSISNGGSAFVTPPLPRTSLSNHQFQTNNGFIREHNRSTSDTPFSSVLDNRYSNDIVKNDLDMRSLKSEVYQLDSQKQVLFNENRALKNENEKLSEQLRNLQNNISVESSNHDRLTEEIIALEKRKKDLLEVNQSLSEQNHKLEMSVNNSSVISKMPSNDTAYTNSIGGTTVGNTPASLPSQNSSSSLIAGAPYNENNYSEEHTETQKATRLKFWRRPKIAPNLVSSHNTNNLYGLQNSTSTQHQIQNNNQNQYTSPVHGQGNQPSQNWNNANPKLSQTYSSQAIRPPNSKNYVNVNGINNNNNANNNTNSNDSLTTEGNNKKGISSFMTKSRSTNILDSFLAGNSAHNSPNGNHETNDPILLTEIDSAPLFNSSIQKRAEYENEKVPLIITKCIAEVEKRGLDVEGIYRISGGNSAIVAIENAFADLPPNSTKDEKQMRKLEDAIGGDVNAVTSALKRYLRKLPDPLLPYAYYDEFIKVALSISANKQDKRINELKLKVINKLPPTNKHVLFLICKHLDLINSYALVNRMNFKNLSVVFAPTLVRDETGEKEMIHMGYRNDVTELMLTNYQKLFYDYLH